MTFRSYPSKRANSQSKREPRVAGTESAKNNRFSDLQFVRGPQGPELRRTAAMQGGNTSAARSASTTSSPIDSQGQPGEEATPPVFAIEDEPLPRMKDGLTAAGHAAVAAAGLLLISAFVLPFTIAFYVGCVSGVILAVVSILLAQASRRVPGTERTALTWISISAIVLSAAAMLDFFTLESGALFAHLLPAFDGVTPLARAAPAVLALVVAGLAFSARVRACAEEVLHTDELRLPTKVQRIERGTAKLTLVREIKEGNTLLLIVGERLPVDGIVVEGSALVDESALTGTVTPILKVVGMHVFAGSTLQSGRILVAVKAIGSQTMLAQLQARPDDELEVAMVARITRNVRASIVFGVGIAVALGVAGYLQTGVVAALAGLGLGLSIGAITALQLSALNSRSISVAVARTGVRVRTAHALSRFTKADTLVLERTGVLTSGGVRVEHVVSFKPYTQQQVLNTAAALESHSDHRHAKAIVAFARGMGAIGFQRVDDVAEDASGISAKLNGKQVAVGNAAYVRRHGVELPDEAIEHATEGKTIVVVAADGIVMGYIALIEPTRAESNRVVTAFHSLGIHVILLTGEHETAALAHGAAVGITDVRADATAAQKTELYATLRSEGKQVIAVSTVVRPDAFLSIVVFAERSTAQSVGGADIIVRSDDLSTLEHVAEALARERVVTNSITRRAWLAAAVTAFSAALPLGGVLVTLVAVLGSKRVVEVVNDSILRR